MNANETHFEVSCCLWMMDPDTTKPCGLLVFDIHLDTDTDTDIVVCVECVYILELTNYHI